MRLVSFRPKNAGTGVPLHIGALIDGDTAVLDFTAYRPSEPAFGSMIALMESGDAGMAMARELLDGSKRDAGAPKPASADVHLACPVPVPASHRGFSLYPVHTVRAAEAMARVRLRKNPDVENLVAKMKAAGQFDLQKDWHERARYFTGNRFSFIGSGEDVIWPKYCELMDFELELGVFVGKKGKDITLEDAPGYIFGYSICNDFSARDTQAVENRGFGKAKDFDTGNALGPCVVTPDEIPDPYNLKMTVRVNGEVFAERSSSSAERTFADVIVYLSDSQTIYPGEFLSGGTVEGGAGMEEQQYLKPGDVVELEIEKIGKLRNKVVKPA